MFILKIFDNTERICQLLSLHRQIAFPVIIHLKASMEKQKKDKCGRWKKTEHDRFMKALEKYGKNWPLVQKAVKTRTLTQVRSHAQKLFLSMTKKDMKQLNNDLEERFGLFCKNEAQKNTEKELEKI